MEITTNLWIGYAPLIYAKEAGMLDGLNIRLNILSSLGESTKLYDSGIIDGFTATQAEGLSVKNNKTLVPAILIDRSYGADAVLSSLSAGELAEKHGIRLDVFYEKGTVNDILLSYLMKKDYIMNNGDRLVFHNYNQDEIWSYNMKGLNSIVITYEPYITGFTKKGYRTLINSRDNGIFVYDALFVKKDSFITYNEDLKALDAAMIASITVLRKHPREFYDKIKNYMQNQSYDEFMKSLGMIKWIELSDDKTKIVKDMKRLGMDTSELADD